MDVRTDLDDPTWATQKNATEAAAKALQRSLPGGDISTLPYNSHDKVGMLIEQFRSNWAAVVRKLSASKPVQMIPNGSITDHLPVCTRVCPRVPTVYTSPMFWSMSRGTVSMQS